MTRLCDHTRWRRRELRITQYPILSWLSTVGPMTMNVLAERMVMDRATLGHNLRPLETQGLGDDAAGGVIGGAGSSP